MNKHSRVTREAIHIIKHSADYEAWNKRTAPTERLVFLAYSVLYNVEHNRSLGVPTEVHEDIVSFLKEISGIHQDTPLRPIKSNRGKPIRCVQTGDVFGSALECCRVMHLSKSGVYGVLHSERPHTKGFTFEYLNQE